MIPPLEVDEPRWRPGPQRRERTAGYPVLPEVRRQPVLGSARQRLRLRRSGDRRACGRAV